MASCWDPRSQILDPRDCLTYKSAFCRLGVREYHKWVKNTPEGYRLSPNCTFFQFKISGYFTCPKHACLNIQINLQIPTLLTSCCLKNRNMIMFMRAMTWHIHINNVNGPFGPWHQMPVKICLLQKWFVTGRVFAAEWLHCTSSTTL